MLIKFFFKLLQNLKWIISLGLLGVTIYVAVTQYQAIKASPVGALLPSLQIPNASELLNKAQPTSATTDAFTPSSVPTPAPTTLKVSIATKTSEVVYTADVARTESQRAIGLMYRASLPTYGGMYFIFPADTREGFWMKNCEIALDILFIDSSNKIVDIKENFAPCKDFDKTQQTCPTYVPLVDYKTVLEINAGSVKKQGIALGQQISIRE